MLTLSNQFGNATQNGKEIAANIMPSPIETMIKSISQAINLSIQLANTIVSAFVVVVEEDGDDDDDDKVVCVFGEIFRLSNISTMAPVIRTIIPETVRMTPAIMPLNELILSWLFAPINGKLPTNTPILTGLFPKLYTVIVYFPVTSGLNVVKNYFVNSLLVIITPFGFRTVSLRMLFGIIICPPVVALGLLLRSTCIANDTGLDVSIT